MSPEKAKLASNVDIVVYALASLGGAGKTVYSEEVAATCFQLAPSQFSWRLPQYRKWPDKYIVKTALEDAKKKANGSLVTGTYALDTSKDGWRLTPQGARWITDNRDRIEKQLNQTRLVIPKIEADRMKKKLRSDSCFVVFQTKRSLDGVSPYAFTDMLGCSPDASNDIIRQRFDHLLASAELAGDEELSLFLKACANRFSDLLASS